MEAWGPGKLADMVGLQNTANHERNIVKPGQTKVSGQKEGPGEMALRWPGSIRSAPKEFKESQSNSLKVLGARLEVPL